MTYCDYALSGVCRPFVRPSVRRPLDNLDLFLFSTSSPEQLDGF